MQMHLVVYVSYKNVHEKTIFYKWLFVSKLIMTPVDRNKNTCFLICEILICIRHSVGRCVYTRKNAKKKVTEIDQIFCIKMKVEWEYFQIYHHFPSEIDILKFKHSIMKKATSWFFVTFCHFFLCAKKRRTFRPSVICKASFQRIQFHYAVS